MVGRVRWRRRGLSRNALECVPAMALRRRFPGRDEKKLDGWDRWDARIGSRFARVLRDLSNL